MRVLPVSVEVERTHGVRKHIEHTEHLRKCKHSQLTETKNTPLTFQEHKKIIEIDNLAPTYDRSMLSHVTNIFKYIIRLY